jgi:hypothetical protein
MRRIVALCCAVLLVGCAPAEEQGISLADVAGTWSVQAFAEGGDSAIVTYELVATDNMEGWTLTFPGRDPIPVTVVAVEGDSIVTDLGPFESALREGVMVSTRAVARLQDGNMVGTFVARYQTTEPDSILRGRQVGTRME